MPAFSLFVSLLLCSLFTTYAYAESADLRSCLEIEDDTQRLNCYDSALGRSTALASETPAVQPPAKPVAEPATQQVTKSEPEPTPVIVSSPPEPASAPAPAPIIAEQQVTLPTPVPTAPAEVESAEPGQMEADFGLPTEPDWEAVKDDRITASVVDVDKTPFGSVIVELDNEHVWQQVDDRRLTLRKGDEVTIRGGMGGSFYLAKTSGSRSLKVKRIK